MNYVWNKCTFFRKMYFWKCKQTEKVSLEPQIRLTQSSITWRHAQVMRVGGERKSMQPSVLCDHYDFSSWKVWWWALYSDKSTKTCPSFTVSWTYWIRFDSRPQGSSPGELIYLLLTTWAFSFKTCNHENLNPTLLDNTAVDGETGG